jgi:hypothetical protein
MKISSKRFVISSEAKNKNGFRVRTEGIGLKDYKSNPLLLWMHKRPEGKRKDEILPIGNIVEIELKDGKLTGKLAFDETDPFALSLYEKVENGTLRMVSAGLLPLTWSEDTDGEMWLETSTMFEVSLVDIGSNGEALAVTLYQKEKDKFITLSYKEIYETNLKSNTDMKIIQLNAPEVLPLLKLADSATPADVQAAISNLVTLAAKSTKQAENIVTLTADRDSYKTKFEAAEKATESNKVIALVDKAVADGKIVEGDKEQYIKLGTADFKTTEAVLKGMVASKSVKDQLENGEGTTEDYAKLSWPELEEKNLLVTLKAEDLPLFKQKFKAQFKTEYKEN